MKLYSQGLKPVYRVLPNAVKVWKRIPGKVNYSLTPIDKSELSTKGNKNEDDEGGSKTGNQSHFALSFQHYFGYNQSETSYFAFSYPFSFEESTEMFDRIEEKLSKPEYVQNIYFHREVLFYSLEGRKMEVFTISSRD